jgi:outer membrane receptor protein involved in Fe transport
MYYEFDRMRRTVNFVNSYEGLSPAVPIWRTVIDQQKAPASFTVDLFANKSWRINRKYFISLNAGVNNLLNNQKIVISGREAYVNEFKNNLLDPRFYSKEILYAPGLNFFFGIALRM